MYRYLIFSLVFFFALGAEDPNGIALHIGGQVVAVKGETVQQMRDPTTQSVTLKQLIHDRIYLNEELNSHKITFIQCDMGGGEEGILEDLLHFAYYNKCPVQIAFYTDRWKRKIADFDYLFKHFKVTHAEGYPTASLLLEPKEDSGDLIKENVTAVIIGYNQYTYIKNMVSQLEKYTTDIVIIDNQSDYHPLLDYYQNDFKYTLLRQKQNFGYTVYLHDWVKSLTGGYYILTDPDLQFNPNLPDDFITQLIDLSDYYQVNKAGFALLIDSDDIRTDLFMFGYPLKEWEGQFWQQRISDYPNPDLELYRAPLDTTFCLVNRKYYQHHKLHYEQDAIRVAGKYTCVHIPWHLNFQNNLAKDEYESYLKSNVSSNFFKLK